MRRLFYMSLLVSFLASPCVAQSQSAEITGVVTDPSGAVVPFASILAITGDGQVHRTAADKHGVYSIRGLEPGLYTIKAICIGFAAFQQDKIRLSAGQVIRVDVSLNIEMQREEVNVFDKDTRVDIDPDRNASALVLQGKDLDILPDDLSQLQAQLQAMAGPGPGPEEPELYVDGFSADKLPPKSAIREIRINQNPYSAQYDRPGRGRTEIFTKPGADAFHGGLWTSGNDSSFNSGNPFVQLQPPYHSVQLDSNLGGPITKKAAFFLNVDWANTQTNAIVDAETLDSNLNQTLFTQAVPNPSTNMGFSSRFDVQLEPNNNATVRYQLGRGKATDVGIGQLALPSQGSNANSLWQSVQISDVQTYGAKVVNQFRFQYSTNRNRQEAQSDAPEITVQGAFTGGGSNVGNLLNNQDHYELQDYVSVNSGRHFVKFGGRLSIVREVNSSTANFNGDFVFSSLDAYQLTAQGLQQGLTAVQIRAEGGGASQFSINSGNAGISVAAADAGLYLEDNWKPRPNLMLSYGFRFETQTDIGKHLDFAPRLGAAWGVGRSRKGPPKTVLRAGYGWFYTRFPPDYVLQAERQNGVNQTQFLANFPDFFPNIPPLNILQAQASQTIYQISPTVRAPYVMQTGISVDRQIVKSATMSVSYLNSRGVDQLISRNINAPLPGTYNPADPASGVRPLGTNENVYQYESEGVFKQNQLIVNVNLRHGSKFTLFGSYALNCAHGNTSGAGSFPSNQYDLNADYGRTLYDIRHRVVLGGSLSLPYGFRLTPFVSTASGAPFNIVVGQDLNGDSLFNDRPAFATNLSRHSVVRTRWGTFDTVPIAGQEIIPVNYGTGPGQFTANMAVGKTFSFGVEHDHQTARSDKRKASAKRYGLTFEVSAQNVLNKVNLAQPVGVLGSPLFGTSTSLSGSSAANRTVNLQMQFTF
jgi:hypothetical protein